MQLPDRITRGGYNALTFGLLGSAFVSLTIAAAVLGDWLVAALAGLMAIMTVMLRGFGWHPAEAIERAPHARDERRETADE